MKILPALLACMFLAPVALTQATLSVYEPFDYPDFTFGDGTTVTGAGMTGTASVRDDFDQPAFSTFVSGDLFYPDLATSAYSLATTVSNQRTMETLTTPLSSGTQWISFLFQTSGNPGADRVGVVLNSDQPAGLFVGFKDASTVTDTVFGLSTVASGSASSSNTATNVGSNVIISNTAIHLIVLSIDFNTSGSFDTINLYVDPAAGVGSPSVAPTTTVTSLDLGNITGIGTQRIGAVTLTIDEIRIGDSFADVVVAAVPEPGVVALFGLGALVLVARRRRQQMSA